MNIAVTQHVKEGAVCVEIVGMNNPIIDLEVRRRSVRDTVAAAGRIWFRIPESGPKIGMAKTSPLVTSTFPPPRITGIAAEAGEIVRAVEEAQRRRNSVQVSQQREIDFAYRNACPVTRVIFRQ